MKYKWILPIIVSVAVLCVIGLCVPETPRTTTSTVQATQTVQNPPTVAELLKLVNEERTKVNVAPLVIDDGLQKASQMKSDDMYNRNYFSHIIKGTNEVSTPEMLKLEYVNCKDVSENITDNTTTEDNTSVQAVYSWVHSPPHYKAMINPDYTYTGFGISGTKIVERFCIAK
jgi:uncharacterized protein YkwD